MIEKIKLYKRICEQRDYAKAAAEANDITLASSWARVAGRNEAKFLALFGETVASFAISYLA